MNLNILQTLAADIRTFDELVQSGTPGRRPGASAVPSGSTTASHAASAEPRLYIPNPLDECTNALGHLADPWSVVRVTAQVSAAQPSGLTGPSLSAQGEGRPPPGASSPHDAVRPPGGGQDALL